MRDQIRQWTRIAHLAAAWLFVGGVIVQVFLAGLALFAEGGFANHVAFGYSAFWIVAILIPILAIGARLPTGDIGLSILLLALFIPQCLLPPLARSGGPGIIAALHPVNALLLFALAIVIGQRAWRRGLGADSPNLPNA
jgi:Family of unknown function (DUF6220)